MQKIFRLIAVSGFILMSACATTHKAKTDATAAEAAGLGKDTGKDSGKDTSELPSNIEEKEVSSEVVEENEVKPYKSAYGEIALDDNANVQVWVRYFQGRGRRYMEQYLARSTRYLPMMRQVLRENGLPEDLVYISLIESGFSGVAHSHSNAVGYWQFIRATGRRYGLNVDPFIDERRDPVLSTRAAAEYFKALYSLFGSWHLAMASYNVGENRVKRAVTKYYTRDFWELIKKRRSLPAETKQYVPKFIAAALIAKDPAKYGFKEIEYADPLSYDTVALQSPISLTKLANNLSVDLDEMKLLNPKFRSDFVPISRGSETVVRIPVGRASDAQAALSMSVTTQPKILNADSYFYKIRRGDNLSTVAKRNRTTVSQIRRLNNLSNRTVLRVGMSLKVPDHGGEGVNNVTVEDAQTGTTERGTGETASTSRASTGRSSDDRASSERAPTAVPAVETRSLDFHVVRRGDNLSTIAQKYRITVGELLRLNNLTSRSVIHRGQKVRLRPDSNSKSASPSRASKTLALAQFKSNSARQHVVRRGETLYDVSKRYGVALNRLARANGRTVSYRVMAGEKLAIPE